MDEYDMYREYYEDDEYDDANCLNCIHSDTTFDGVLICSILNDSVASNYVCTEWSD